MMLATRPLRSHKKMAEQVRDAVSDYIREQGLKAGDRVVVRGGFVLKSELLKDQMVGE